MQRAGVPIVPGASAPVDDLGPRARRWRARSGYPVMVKAAAGGGGQGHAGRARRPSELAGALETAAARGAQGLRRRRRLPREVHRAARGTSRSRCSPTSTRTVHLGERECSIQRRHQKLVEEAPSVAVDAELREWMGAAAVAAAEAVGYRGAGTCEFLLARRRLVLLPRDEHADPGRAPGHRAGLRGRPGAGAAPDRRGRAMRCRAGWLSPRGWAIECRITSEDPANGFLPSTGRIEYLRVPGGPGRPLGWRGRGRRRGHAVLRLDAGQAHRLGARPGRRPSRACARALDELVMLGCRDQPGVPPPAAGRPRVPGRRDRHPVPRAPRPICSQPARVERATSCELAVAAALAEDEARRLRRPAVARR